MSMGFSAAVLSCGPLRMVSHMAYGKIFFSIWKKIKNLILLMEKWARIFDI